MRGGRCQVVMGGVDAFKRMENSLEECTWGISPFKSVCALLGVSYNR